MAILNVVSAIREYAGIAAPKSSIPKLDEFNSVLMSCFYRIEWEQIGVRKGFAMVIGRKSLKNVYICKSAGLVVKVTYGLKMRGENNFRCGRPTFPYAEPAASGVAQEFNWPEIPNTVMVYEGEYERYPEYQHLMLCFFHEPLKSIFPITFIFQSIVHGKILPFEAVQRYEWNLERPRISTSSYQRAFLLALLLGKEDAHGGNTMYDPETGSIYEVDNSSISGYRYSAVGALHYLTDLKAKPLDETVRQTFLAMSKTRLNAVLERYREKSLQLAAIWAKERYAKTYCDLGGDIENIFDLVTMRFNFMQKLCQGEEAQTLTLGKIADALEREFGNPSSFAAERAREEEQGKEQIARYQYQQKESGWC